MRPELIDTHCHLYLDAGGSEAQLAAWERARGAGVAQAVIPAIDVASSRAVVALADPARGLFAAVGIHPNDTVAVAESDHVAIAELAAAPGVVAIGESGLDCYRDRAALPRQVESLRRHAELALARDLPLILHVRQAFAPTAEVLAPFAARGLRAVMHCFDGGPGDLEPWLAWGFLISFSGIVTYPKRDDLRAAARVVPADRVVVETDAPFLAPVPKRGRPNEPAFLLHTAEAVAAARGEPLTEFAARSTANARRLFRLPAAAR
ncbi:MAG: TatD family deoxyribonuclease [Planctomycetes bacterium]|nr:TatD family deoxyribonuclease [Planctomycetota bacterium]